MGLVSIPFSPVGILMLRYLGAMNSLGAGGEETPFLVNGANALTFCLMVLSCFFSSIIVRFIGIKGALIFGTMGYAPYAAGLYTNNRYGNSWFVLFGAALCGISAGVFWMAVSVNLLLAQDFPMLSLASSVMRVAGKKPLKMLVLNLAVDWLSSETAKYHLD